MMKNSCISHPKCEPLIIRRQWQVEFCGGNTCAAELMSFFEYWHNIKLEQSSKARQSNRVAEEHGDAGTQDTTHFQFHNEDELIAGLLGGWSGNTINKALKYLVEKQVITITSNPNTRYKFDRTRYFLFHPEIPERWLASRSLNSEESTRKSASPSQNFDLPSRNFEPPSSKSDGAITESTQETSFRDYTHRGWHSSSEALFCDGKLIASRNDYKEIIDSRIAHEQITGDQAWAEICKDLLAIIKKQSADRANVSRTFRNQRE